ncbi:MAG: AMP-binding protein [Dehalococcoidia bacterium]|nr:AMP-binding protein [Dehalococcoidia bacterium]
MLVIPGDQGRVTCDGLTRRELMRVGGSALLGLSLPQFLQMKQASAVAGTAPTDSPFARAPGFNRAKNVILVYLQGGPSHLDLWDPKTALRLISQEGVTWTMGATPFLLDLTRTQAIEQYNISSLRYFVSGGATIPSALVEEAHQRLPCRVISVWGMTENGAATFVRPGDPPGMASVSDGVPVPGMEVRVVDPLSRAPAPFGEEGLLLVRGPQQFVGYFKRPNLWEASHDARGWFDTGDLARMEQSGYIRITGRVKDIIIRGGENIPVVEVEEILFRHPKVREIALVAMPDPRLGERTCACVVLKPDETLSLEEMQVWFRQAQTAKQYWPESLELFEELPKTPSGKVQKFLLRKIVNRRQSSHLGK